MHCRKRLRPMTWITTLFHGAILLAMPAAQAATDRLKDPHYTPAGFFDIHVCNWPDQPLFFKALFSTRRFDEIESVTISYPDGSPLGELGLERFRLIQKKGEPEKRVFITDFDVPQDAPDGVYRASVRLKNGETVPTQDKVLIRRMGQIGGQQPAPDSEVTEIPKELKWQAVEGAQFYQVFVRDMWQDGKLVFQSKLVKEPRVSVPAGTLQPGGFYAWRIHARDINEDIDLGDFNHGSINREATFTIAD